MGYSVEELIKEAKELNTKIETDPESKKNKLEIDEIEKLASTLEAYLKEDKSNYYGEVMEKAASASKEDLMKIASFCKVAMESGYSEKEILGQLEKTAYKGLVPIAAKAIKTVVGAPLKGAKALAFGTKASQAAAKERKVIQSAASKMSKGRKQQYTAAKVSRGSAPTSKGFKSIEQKSLRQAQTRRAAEIKAKTLVGRKSIGAIPKPSLARKMVKPVAMVGGGATAGIISQRALKDRQQQPTVSYGY